VQQIQVIFGTYNEIYIFEGIFYSYFSWKCLTIKVLFTVHNDVIERQTYKTRAL